MKKLRWHKQETSSSCLLACLRMVLDFYGIVQPESILRRMCKTKAFGTHPINVVYAVKEFGLESYADVFELHQLAELLKQNIPPIVTIFDEQDETIISHALVVQKIEKRHVKVLDPEVGRRKLMRAEFEKLWFAAGRLAIMIKKN